jgi:hypothetical protein
MKKPILINYYVCECGVLVHIEDFNHKCNAQQNKETKT